MLKTKIWLSRFPVRAGGGIYHILPSQWLYKVPSVFSFKTVRRHILYHSQTIKKKKKDKRVWLLLLVFLSGTSRSVWRREFSGRSWKRAIYDTKVKELLLAKIYYKVETISGRTLCMARVNSRFLCYISKLRHKNGKTIPRDSFDSASQRSLALDTDYLLE